MTGNVQPRPLTIELLDSSRGNVVQTWHFEGRRRVTIGRAVESDIRLADASVSRVHVELNLDESRDQWQLKSLGRNGTRVNGEFVAEVYPVGLTVFQLGTNGPRFRIGLEVVNTSDQMTLVSETDSSGLDFLAIDEEQKAREINKFIEGDGFQTLLEKARSLREMRQSAEQTPTP